MVNTKLIYIVTGGLLAEASPYLINKYGTSLTNTNQTILWVLINIFILYLVWQYYLKDLLSKGEVKPKRQINNFEAKKMLQSLKKNPDFGSVDNYIEEIDIKDLSKGSLGKTAPFIAVQARGNFYKQYCYLLINIYDTDFYNLSKPQDEPYLWEDIRQDAIDLAEEKEPLSKSKVTKTNLETGEAFTIEETKPTLPELPPKTQGESFTV